MPTDAYGLNPNSQHQMWSRWIFAVEPEAGRHPPRVSVLIDNMCRFSRAGFKSTVGRVRCEHTERCYSMIVEIEGPPAHDPGYVASVKKEFIAKFMVPAFGSGARLARFEVGVLSGDKQDGTPPDQLLILPQLSGV